MLRGCPSPGLLRRPFLRRKRLDRQRMDLAAHALAERAVDQLVARQRPQAGELARRSRAAKCVLSSERTSTCASGSAGADQLRDLLWGSWRHDLKASAASRLRARRYHGATRDARMTCRSNTSATERRIAAAHPPAAPSRSRPRRSRRCAPRLDGALRRRPAACACDCRGRVVVTGMGKSGHVARKIAATLASTGTPGVLPAPRRSQPWRSRHDHARRCWCWRCPTPARPPSCCRCCRT